MDQKKRTIYAHIFPDKSIYIGQTSQEKLYKRFQYGQGYDKQPEIYEKIMFWGWSNIEHVVLEEGVMTKEQCNKKECDYTIDYFNKGYNVLNKYNTVNPYRYRKKNKEYVYIDLLTNKEYSSLRAAAADIGYSHERVRQSVTKGDVLRGGHKFIKVIKEEEEYEYSNKNI